MIKFRSPFAAILISFVPILITGAGQGDYTVTAGPYPEQEPAGNSLSVKPSGEADSLTLTYIANMGVLIKTGDSKIMIDCLFDGPGNYRRPSSQTLDSMVNGIPPFDNIDMVLVTHKDPDHFDAAVVARYMETRPEPILVVPADAAEQISAAESEWSEIESRVVIVDLEIGRKLDTVLANIPITIFSTTHGTSPYPMNLMYLIEPNGWRVFHEGDASGRPEDYRAFGLDTLEFDLAVVQYSWPLHPHRPYRLFFQNDFTSAHIALAHVRMNMESAAEERINEVRKYYHDIFVLLPGMPTKVFYR